MVMAPGLGIITLVISLIVFIALIALIFAYRRKNDPLKWYRIRLLWLYIIFPVIGIIINSGLIVAMVLVVFLFHIMLWCVGIKIWYSSTKTDI
jgi:uncharacterized membrane protein YoaK (UPF0700 family)